MESFDIVLLDDQSMDFVNSILRVILFDSAITKKSQSQSHVEHQNPQKVSVDNWPQSPKS
jgi:hypothetical protein